jgi:hypothetical protein
MSDDLIEAFDAVVADGGNEQVESLSRNANVYLGDDDGGGETDSETDVSELVGEEDVDSETEEADIVDIADDDSDVEDVTDEFDFDSIKDKTVSVVVGGETFDVPLTELRNGYMRQADYTRKTQQISQVAELARWAQDMQNALRDNPKGTVKYLQEALGIGSESEDPWQDVDPDMQPVLSELQRTQAELADLRSRSEQAEQARIQAEVRVELDQMKSRYSDFDPQVVLPIAIETGLNMEKAYKLWKADRLEQDSAASAKAREKAEAAAAKREKARKASQKVAKGGSNVAASSDDSWKKFDSFEDIFAYEFEKSR